MQYIQWHLQEIMKNRQIINMKENNKRKQHQQHTNFSAKYLLKDPKYNEQNGQCYNKTFAIKGHVQVLLC